MSTATLVTEGGRQTVRLPKDMQFVGVTEVKVMREGERIVFTPKRDRAQPPASSVGERMADTLGDPAAAEIDFDPRG